MTSLKVGDKVRVKKDYSAYNGKVGKILKIYGVPARPAYIVNIDGAKVAVSYLYVEKVEPSKKKKDSKSTENKEGGENE